MKILVDAVLFQLGPADSEETRFCARVLAAMVRLAVGRDLGLTILDRGNLPSLGQVETMQFPSYKAENAVADGEMLERMSRLIGADAVVSTALTMPPSVPAVQLLFGSEAALLPGRAGGRETTECEIALTFASAVVFASPATEEAFRSRFPRRGLHGQAGLSADTDVHSRASAMAEAALDAAVRAAAAPRDAERDRRFLALRHMQAAFELPPS